MTAVLSVADLSVRHAGVEALKAVSLEVGPGSVVGLIGPNGAGKTTLVDAVAGFVAVAAGRISFLGSDVTHLPPHARARLGLARTFQSLELFEELTVGEHLLVAREGAGRHLGEDRARWGALALELLELEHLADRVPAELSHAQRKLVALSRALAAGPALVLLDEPAAGLDAAERRALASRLRRLAGEGVALVVADHDMDLVLGVSDQVWALDLGQVVAHGPPGAVRSHPRVVDSYLGGDGDGDGDGDGGGAAAVTRPEAGGPRPRPVAGVPVLEVEGLRAGYGQGGEVVRGVDLRVDAGEVVALLGANGAGKTTTLLAVSGVLAPTAGQVRVAGAPVRGRAHRVARRGLAHVPQGRALFHELTVAENLQLAARSRRMAAAPLLEQLPALAALLGRPAGQLSGGEQQLVALARGLLARPRVLLVDELSLGLAPKVAGDLLGMVRRMADEEGTAVLVVEQHVQLALEVADRACVLARGRIVLEAPAADLAGRRDLLEAAYLGPDQGLG